MKRLSYLVIAAYDSMNGPLAALVRELRRLGRSATVVGNMADAANLAVFESYGISVVDVEKFPFERLDGIDVAVLPPVSVPGLGRLTAEIRRRRLFTASFASLFSSVVMREQTDLVLAAGESKFAEFAENGLDYPMVAVGNPQYDGLIEARRTREAQQREEGPAAEKPIRRVLFVEQGGYPYGETGRRELAKTLCAMASFNPSMSFFIKPRHYGGSSGRKTHEQTGGLIELVRDAPSNLAYLDRPANLEEIVCDFDAVVAMWSTAHLAAAVCGLPLILIGGLPSLDVFDVRTQRVQQAYERLEATGCVHDYRELQAVPVAFCRVSPDYLAREAYGADTPAAPRAIAAIERARSLIAPHSETRSQGRMRRWKKPFQLSFDDFMERADGLVQDADPHDEQLQASYLVQLNSLVQEWTYTNRCLGQPICMDGFRAYFSRDVESREDAEAAIADAQDRWDSLYGEYFGRSDTEAAAARDGVLQDYWFDWLRETGRHGLLQDQPENLLAPESLAYNRARAALDAGNEKRAFDQLQVFLDEATCPQQAPRRKAKHAVVLLKPFMARKHLGAFARFALRPGNGSRIALLGKRAAGVSSTGALIGYAVKALPDFRRKDPR